MKFKYEEHQYNQVSGASDTTKTMVNLAEDSAHQFLNTVDTLPAGEAKPTQEKQASENASKDWPKNLASIEPKKLDKGFTLGDTERLSPLFEPIHKTAQRLMDNPSQVAKKVADFAGLDVIANVVKDEKMKQELINAGKELEQLEKDCNEGCIDNDFYEQRKDEIESRIRHLALEAAKRSSENSILDNIFDKTEKSSNFLMDRLSSSLSVGWNLAKSIFKSDDR